MNRQVSLKWLRAAAERAKRLGPLGTLKMVIKTNILRSGTLVGVDELGNTYYENPSAQHGRTRWVELASKSIDASEVPPHWHRWLHYTTDEIPKASDLNIKYRKNHKPNMTGTKAAYLPSSFFLSQHYKPVKPHRDDLTEDELNAELQAKRKD